MICIIMEIDCKIMQLNNFSEITLIMLRI